MLTLLFFSFEVVCQNTISKVSYILELNLNGNSSSTGELYYDNASSIFRWGSHSVTNSKLDFSEENSTEVDFSEEYSTEVEIKPVEDALGSYVLTDLKSNTLTSRMPTMLDYISLSH